MQGVVEDSVDPEGTNAAQEPLPIALCQRGFAPVRARLRVKHESRDEQRSCFLPSSWSWQREGLWLGGERADWLRLRKLLQGERLAGRAGVLQCRGEVGHTSESLGRVFGQRFED